MSAPVRKRGFLLNLAAEGMAPLVPGCAAALKSQRGIDLFGPYIVPHWLGWGRAQPPAVGLTAITELADLPLAKAKAEAVAEIEKLTPTSSQEDRTAAIAYLTAIPKAAQRGLVLDGVTGSRTVPKGGGFDYPKWPFRLLPHDVPPYLPGEVLPGTPYTLTDFAGDSNLGVFFRATRPETDTTFLIKVCVNASLVALLKQLPIRQISGRWSERLVRPLEQNLDHATPYFVFEHFPGGDLAKLQENLRHQTGRGFAPDEVFRLIEQIAEGLAFAHALGMVHGDLKVSNVLVSGDALKIADINLGVAVAEWASRREEPFNGPSDLMNLCYGAATITCRAKDWEPGQPCEPRHDLYSLGVLWYQLLRDEVGGFFTGLLDLPKDLPDYQRLALESCVGPPEQRPRDGHALLALLRPGAMTVVEGHHESVVSPEEVRRERLRKQALLSALKALRRQLEVHREEKRQTRRLTAGDFLLGLLAGGLAVALSRQIEMVVISLIVILAASLTRQKRRTRHLNKSFDEVRGSVRDMAREHPDEVQTWGGESVLLNADLLSEIVASFEEDMRTLSPDLEEEAR